MQSKITLAALLELSKARDIQKAEEKKNRALNGEDSSSEEQVRSVCRIDDTAWNKKDSPRTIGRNSIYAGNSDNSNEEETDSTCCSCTIL